jgi:myo-inositol-1(or 4)-monophosphatase
MSELIAVAEEAARAAGALLLERFADRGALEISSKSTPTDLVSEADLAAERCIRAILHERVPDDGIVGEEGDDVASRSGRHWVVDPLDGTVNYLYGRPDWAVSIAAEDEAGALVGVVHQPSTGITWQAVRDGGATRNGVRLEVLESRALASALVSTGFSYLAERRAEQAEYLRDVLPAVRDLRRGGSAALDLCAVADSTVDAYYEHVIQRWDVAAGGLIAREAGAQTIGGGDSPLPYGVLAAAPSLAAALLELLTNAQRRLV